MFILGSLYVELTSWLRFEKGATIGIPIFLKEMVNHDLMAVPTVTARPSSEIGKEGKTRRGGECLAGMRFKGLGHDFVRPVTRPRVAKKTDLSTFDKKNAKRMVWFG